MHQDWTPVVIRKKKEEAPPAPSIVRPPNENVIKKPTKELGEAMMRARLDLKLKQSDLAKKCNVTTAIINDMEMGRGTYDPNVTNKVCKALGIQVHHRAHKIQVTE